MRTRHAVLVGVLASAVAIAGCSEEARDQVRDAVGTAVDQGTEASAPIEDAEEPPAEEEAAPARPAEPEQPAAEPEQPAAEDERATVEQPEGAEGPAAAAVDDALSDDGDTTTVLVLLVILLAVVVLALSLRRHQPSTSDRSATPPNAAQQHWQARARNVYSDVRWLQDRLNVEVAAWRAAELVDPQRIESADPRARDWYAVERRLPLCLEELYDLEGQAPTAQQQQAVREVTRSLQELHESVGILALRLAEQRTEVRPDAAASSGEAPTSPGGLLADDVRTARHRVERSLVDLSRFLTEGVAPSV